MKLFSVPADFQKSTIDQYVKLNNSYSESCIHETYGNISIGNSIESGRALSQLPKIDFLDLHDYVVYAEKNDISFNYTINAAYMNNKEFSKEGVREIIGFLEKLYKVGIRNLTIAMPSLMEIVKSMKYDFNIKASTICFINNPQKALVYKNLGIDRLVIDESIHRDFRTLGEIVDLVGSNVEVIVNTMCHKNCRYRIFHYNETSGDSVGQKNEVGVNFFEHKCILQRYDTVGDILKLGWIRPEDIKLYEKIGIKHFKFQGRQHVSNPDHIKAIECYFKEDFNGNLLDLLDMMNTRYRFKVNVGNKKLDGFLKPFYENKVVCRNNCTKCGYCDLFAKKAIELKAADEIIGLAKKFYSECDEFNILLNDSHDEYNNQKQLEDSLPEFIIK